MEQCLEYGHSHGGEVCLPFVLGATPDASGRYAGLNYGFLWNMPNYGGVDFGKSDASKIVISNVRNQARRQVVVDLQS